MRALKTRAWFRGGITLAVAGALMAGSMLAPAGAQLRKSIVKKIATKIFNQRIGPATAPFLRDDVTTHTADSPENSNSPKILTVACPAGKIALGGGASTFGAGFLGLTPAEVTLVSSNPAANPATGPSNQWFGYAQEAAATAANWSLRVHVICATP